MVLTSVQEIAQINFGSGKVGQRYKLETEQQKAQFEQSLVESTKPLTKTNTADCGDERETISLADGTTDLTVIRNRIVPQLFGGIGLALTKAMVAANAVAVRDAKDMQAAFEIVDKLLRQFGYENAGHADCGASKSVQSSVANQIPLESLTPAASLFIPDKGQNKAVLSGLTTHKQKRLQDGFFNDWDPAWHQDFLIEKYPQNFSFLKVDENDHDTHGHNGSGLYVVTKAGEGFQKNGRAFSLTLPFMQEIAYKFGGSDDERRDILYGLVDDSLHVGGGIVVEGFPVFAQAA